jgi:hypothetical protein
MLEIGSTQGEGTKVQLTIRPLPTVRRPSGVDVS